MMQIKDIVEFDKKRYFGGAIQANWFYDNEKVSAITESYVFHGQKYHGVSERDNFDTKYKLYDTASYSLDLLRRVNDKESNKFCLTIAGYGTGKSHLVVTLAALMSGHNISLRNAAIERIAAVDKNIAAEILSYNEKNLILVFNGMNNFNLDYETLSVARAALKQHGVSAEVLNSLTKQYEQAKHFVETTFAMVEERYLFHFNNKGIRGECSKNYIIKHLECNAAVFDAVNEVYKEINGSYIQWERGISAGDILTLLDRVFCCEQKIFNKIIILFDEFGRYIEYAATNPLVAGDSSLQQVFEAIQNADGNILFDGFIQSDLNAYLSRIDKTSNIVRYVGRYEISDKYYISSNFETILANLITKKDEQKFKEIVEYNIDVTYSTYHSRIHTNLIRWNKGTLNKSVWSDNHLYDSVISKGCYPIHPFAVWFLSNTSDWMQQRSTIAFAEEMFFAIKDKNISVKWIEYIYAVDIIDSALFAEMLNSEEKGLVQSQYCMLFRDIMLKSGDKMTDTEKTALKAILIIDLCKFSVANRNDCLDAVKYCSNLSDVEIEKAINGLENNHGVISFDSNTSRFDLMAEANGINEFKREYIRKKLMVRGYNGIASCDDELSHDLNLVTPEETPFAFEHNINSSEWCFEKRLMCASDFNNDCCKNLSYYFNNAIDGETPRGVIIYLYCDKMADRDIEIIHKLYIQYNFNEMPLILYLLIDKEEKLLDVLRSREALRCFSPSEKDRFSRFIMLYNREFTKRISKSFKEMFDERKFIGKNGIEVFDTRLRNMCMKLFESVFPKTVPFMFDGFEKRISPQAKKNFAELCNCMYNGSMTNAQMYQSFAPQLKNRIQAVLSTSTTQTSWQVFDSRYRLCDPQNSAVKRIYNEVKEQITPDLAIGIGQLFNKYLYAPYGMNRYCLNLFIIYFICHNSGKIQVLQGDEVVKKADFIQRIIQNDKKMLESLMRLKIKLSDKTNDALIEELCLSISNNKYVEFCNSLSKQFDTLKTDLEDVELYKDKFATVEMHLADGKRLYDQLYTNGIIPAEKAFAEIELNFSLLKLSNAVYGKIQRRTADMPIDEYSSYLYSEEYCTRVSLLLSKADDLLDKKCSSHIKKLNCAISEISQFKSKYTKVIKQLVKIGRKDYADALNERVKEIVYNVSLQQKYAQTFAEVDKELIFIGTAEDLDYLGFEEQTKKLQKWKEHFSSITDLDKNVVDSYLIKIATAIDNVSKRKNAIKTQIDSLLDKIPSDEADINSFYSDILKLKALKLPDEIDSVLDNTLLTIDEYRNVIKNSNVTKQSIDVLTVEYELKWKNTVCAKAMKLYISVLNKSVLAKRQLWLEENIADMVFKVEDMSAVACVQWQNRCAECPDYLTEDDISKLHNVQMLVNARLKSLKIQGVVEMFNELSDAEKAECLKYLMGNYGSEIV